MNTKDEAFLRDLYATHINPLADKLDPNDLLVIVVFPTGAKPKDHHRGTVCFQSNREAPDDLMSILRRTAQKVGEAPRG